MQTTAEPQTARGPVGRTTGRREGRITRSLAGRLRRPRGVDLPAGYRALDVRGPEGSGFAVIGVRCDTLTR
jgi:hypothetical protein